MYYDRSNHYGYYDGYHDRYYDGYYDGYYDDNTWFLHLSHRILPYLMTIVCEMNQILLRTIKKPSEKTYSWRKNVLPSW